MCRYHQRLKVLLCGVLERCLTWAAFRSWAERVLFIATRQPIAVHCNLRLPHSASDGFYSQRAAVTEGRAAGCCHIRAQLLTIGMAAVAQKMYAAGAKERLLR